MPGSGHPAIAVAHRDLDRLRRLHGHPHPPVGDQGIGHVGGHVRIALGVLVAQLEALRSMSILPPGQDQPLARGHVPDPRGTPGVGGLAAHERAPSRGNQRARVIHPCGLDAAHRPDVGVGRVAQSGLDRVELGLEGRRIRQEHDRDIRLRGLGRVRAGRLEIRARGHHPRRPLAAALQIGLHEAREISIRGRTRSGTQQQSGEDQRGHAGARPHDGTVSRGRVRQRSCIQNHCSGARRMAASIARLNVAV